MSAIGIERVNYFALYAKDPERAAKFAAERLGFSLEHAASDGSHYLRAHGVDRYSLVYKPGDTHGLHHVSYVVGDAAGLDRAEARLTKAGISVSRHLDAEWESHPAIRFRTPAGHQIELTTGVHVDIPVAHAIEAPTSDGPTPITADHLGLGAVDIDTETRFVTETLGQLISTRFTDRDGNPTAAFTRSPGRYLFHDLVVFGTPKNIVHHLQFSMKNFAQFYDSFEALRENEVTIGWGPLRHGSQNVALYFADAEGYTFEYSTNEQIILNDETYVPETKYAQDSMVKSDTDVVPPSELPDMLLGPAPEEILRANAI